MVKTVMVDTSAAITRKWMNRFNKLQRILPLYGQHSNLWCMPKAAIGFQMGRRPGEDKFYVCAYIVE